MRLAIVPLMALALAFAAPHGRAVALNPTKAVVVDPADLRKPVPEPEQGLTEKYDGKLVRFTGTMSRSTFDKKARTWTYELHHVIVHQSQAKNKKPVVLGKETVVVPVHFLKDEKQLRARESGFTLTVEGKGSVMVDGTLVITEAVVVKE